MDADVVELVVAVVEDVDGDVDELENSDFSRTIPQVVKSLALASDFLL